MAGWNEAEASAILRRHEGREGPLLPILHDLQAAFGCVPADAVPYVAHALNMSRAEVHGVVSFYHDFRHEPAGRHVLKLCRAEACQARGSEPLANWAQIKGGDRVTIETVYCLGLCSAGPAARRGGEVFARLDEAGVVRLIEEA